MAKKAGYDFKVLWDVLKLFIMSAWCDVRISVTNSKLGSIPSFNLLPGCTCSNEAKKTCMVQGCYAVKNVFRCGYDHMKNAVLKAWALNTACAKLHPRILEKKINEYLKNNKPAFFRIHSSGDFFSVKYARMWLRIAQKNPDTIFLAFTKQWDIVKQVKFYKVKNFSLVLSGWTGITIPEELRKYYHCAWCNDGKETRIPENALKCPGNCETCGLCWTLNEIDRDVYFNKH